MEQYLFDRYFKTSKHDFAMKTYYFNLYLTAYFNNRNLWT